MVKHYRKGPLAYNKRAIRRVRSYIFNNVTNAQANVTIFTAPEDMTLVRLRSQGSVLYQVEGTALQTMETEYSIWPRGIQVTENLVSSVADKIDDDVPDELLFSCVFQALNNIADNDIIREFEHSNKAQRKLNKGDLVKLSHIASSAVSWRLFAIVDMWFKLV